MSDFTEKVVKTGKYYQKKTRVRLRELRFVISKVSLSQPIFVIGCSRAGTTLVYKTFSESRQLGSLQKETHDFWSSLHPIDQLGWDSHSIPADLASDQDRVNASRLFYKETGHRRIVDKNNQNGLSIPYLYKLFPDAHFIFIRRNPGDNIESLIRGWGKPEEFATWSKQLPETVDIDNGQYNRWCFFLTDGWQNYCHASIEDVCAFQYASMNKAIMQASGIVPRVQWHEVAYEDIVNDPVKSFEHLFQSCGLNFDSALKQHCESVLQRPYNTFSGVAVDKWRQGAFNERIERALGSINTICNQLGY
ncbi:MAG: sulfotransferase [Candidatus Reddybacter sp.]